MATLQVVETQEGDWGFTKDGALMHRGEPHEAKARARAQVARAAGDVILPGAGRVTVSAARVVAEVSPPDLTAEFDAAPAEIEPFEVSASVAASGPEAAEKPAPKSRAKRKG